MTMETRITSLIVLPEGEPIFSERATIVRIEDEAGGEYIVVSQDSVPGRGNVAINPEEWPDIRDAIERMIAQRCRLSITRCGKSRRASSGLSHLTPP